MNGTSTVAKPTPPPPPPPPPPSSSLITSLASHSKSKQQPGGISLAEALATSVADYICDKQRMNNGACSALSSSTMTTTMAVESNSTRQIRLVGSEEQSNPALADARIHASADKSKAADTTSSTSSRSVNRSSMSSAVADLASGMCIFGSNSSSGAGSGGDYCQGNNNNNNSGSAPIISGTAAAVLALHSASCSNNSNYDNIVSSNSSRGSAERKMMIATAASAVTAGREGGCGREGFTPNPSETSVILAGGAQAIADIAPASTASKKMHDHNISNDISHSPTLSSSSPSKFQMRYSDGAPIIAGTAAAAQMRAIATAVQITCATTKKIDNGGGMMSDCDAGIINPVAILGSRGDDSSNFGSVGHDHYHRASVGGVRVGESHQRHGFSSTGGGGEAGAAATATTITKQGSNVLSWVDHRSYNTRVTPDSGPSAPEGYSLCRSSAYQVKCLSNTQQDMTSTSHSSEPRAVSSTTSTLAGGMDILAEITCHAPPMPLPSSLSRTSTTASTTAMTTANKINSYPQQNYGIPSYQEIFHQATSSSSSQEQHSQVHQALQHDQVPHESVSSESAKRVLAIPSYQEIYREMGLSPQERHHPSQRHHFNFSYSVEEVQVDSHRLSSHQSESFHPHAIHHQHHILPSSIDDPTKLSKSNQCHANSRSPTAHFGHVNRGDIEEGKELYTRKDLYRFGGHVSEMKDIHGNMKDGCDSLVVGNMEKDLREGDGLIWFLYSTDRTNGGGALCQSYHKKRPIRIFRSSLLGGKYAPPFLDVEDDIEEDSDVAYRYDGLYMVCAVWDIQGQETESHPVSGENGWQTYFFTRLPKKPLEKEKWEDGMEYNAMGCQELWSTIQKMRGVRKPKKFEIPPPPVKLGPLKKCAISGAFKDRKAVGFTKAVGEMHVAVPRPPPQSKSPRTVPTENPRRKPHLQENNDLSGEISLLRDADCDDESDSDILDQQQQHQRLQLSAPTSFKVLTHRPRLNSMLESSKATPSTRNDDAESSDSESYESASQIDSKQNKRRKPSPTQKKSNDVDISAFIPKRATAAKAEAANRDMFGASRSHKRKSSESHESAISEIGAKLPMQSGAGRKRNRIRHPGENYSSSSEERQAKYVVDQSIITIGSRVLVAYKGALYKATIRKRREKSGKHDFMIHYDGNKKSNVHWIPVDHINKILEINVDTPPKKTSYANGGGGGVKSAVVKEDKNSVGKRKAPVKQESLESNRSKRSQDEAVPPEESDSDDDQDIDETHSSDEVPVNPVPIEEADATKDPGGLSEMNDNSSENVAIEKTKYCAVLESDEGSGIEELESASGTNDMELDHKDFPTPVLCNTETNVPSSDAASRMPRMTVVSDVCIVESPKSSEKEASTSSSYPNKIGITLTEKAEADSNGDGSESESDENSTSISGNPKQEQATSEPMADLKYPVGGHVYVEYRQIFYSSTILKTRRKRATIEYLVHYEGYKKSSNTWVKETSLHKVNALTIKRFEEQRIVPTDNLHESEQPSEVNTAPRRKKAPVIDTLSSDNGSSSTTQKKLPTPRLRSDASDAALDSLESGVAFLAGSMVFAEWTGALFLAKMLKKRYAGDRMEYLISYDGYNSKHDAWVSIRKIYEVNPQTKRVYKQLNLDMNFDGKRRQRGPPCPEQRETRKKAKDDDAENVKNSQPPSRTSSRAASQLERFVSSLSGDMLSIESGVEFLPGSTLFAEYKGGLCLAKMLKKRGKGEYMEYYIQYNGLKKAEEAWVSTALVYEINPQTKRMFRQLSVTK